MQSFTGVERMSVEKFTRRLRLAAGKLERVFADETRPWLQGSRLTAAARST